jgi:putative membrane protein
LKQLREAVLGSLERAKRMKRSDFEVGVARVLTGFSCRDGIGPGGICALTIRADDQTSVYVTIDANNMVSGLRDRVLKALKELGIEEGEILTTDTHLVNAVIMNRRGYHPLGEAIPQEKVISDIKRTVEKALRRMKSASVTYIDGNVSKVGVIGEEQIRVLPRLADEALQKATRTAIPLFGATAIFVTVLFSIL